MKRIEILCFVIVLMSVGFQISAAVLPGALGEIEDGNTTIQGINGYLVIPSAEPAWGGNDLTITTGYSVSFSGSLNHLPYVQVGFNHDFEAGLASELSNNSIDLLLNGKWRFNRSGDRSLAAGVNGQFLDITSSMDWAVQLYFASTFKSTFIDWPAKTTILVGYTLDGSPDTDIDFGLGFQVPFMEDFFSGKVDFLLDYGNVSYSAQPKSADASHRGMLNIGFRLLPVKLAKGMYLSADLRGLDLFDGADRAASLGLGISYQP